MRLILSLIAAIMVMTAPLRANEAAIADVISGQIAAFQADDLVTAFGFASPTIQGIFGDPARFGEMVQQGYPMVWRPAEVEFLSLETIDGRLWQGVMMRDQSGQSHYLDYEMIETPEGWKINGVRFRQPPDGLV